MKGTKIRSIIKPNKNPISQRIGLVNIIPLKKIRKMAKQIQIKTKIESIIISLKTKLTNMLMHMSYLTDALSYLSISMNISSNSEAK